MLGHRNHRRGFTLLEMLLVLALIVTVASLAVPSIRGSLRGQRLRQGAERLRAELIAARVKAMRTGITHAFVLSTTTGAFLSLPHAPNAEELTEAQLGALAAQTDAAATIQAGGSLPEGVGESLPEGVTFGAVSAWDDHSMQGAVGAASGGGGEIVPSILFFPDGTSTNAQFTVVGERGDTILVTLRGLTGTVRVGNRQVSLAGSP